MIDDIIMAVCGCIFSAIAYNVGYVKGKASTKDVRDHLSKALMELHEELAAAKKIIRQYAGCSRCKNKGSLKDCEFSFIPGWSCDSFSWDGKDVDKEEKV